jgi:hypothetical protein
VIQLDEKLPTCGLVGASLCLGWERYVEFWENDSAGVVHTWSKSGTPFHRSDGLDLSESAPLNGYAAGNRGDDEPYRLYLGCRFRL